MSSRFLYWKRGLKSFPLVIFVINNTSLPILEAWIEVLVIYNTPFL